MRTHLLLVVAMAGVIASITCFSLLLVRERMQQQMNERVSGDLRNSVHAFNNLQSERLDGLRRENALLADLPTLKALLTSHDDLTIQDGAKEFWQLSGEDVFALADPSGRLIAAYTRRATANDALLGGLRVLLAEPSKFYVLNGSELYACSRQPLYFGTRETGTLLGYVISGISIDRTMHDISAPIDAEAAFISGSRVVASTLPAARSAELLSQVARRQPSAWRTQLGGVRFLASVEDLSRNATAPLQLIVLKSLAPAQESISQMDHLLLLAGVLALAVGTALMIALAHLVTKPLEQLLGSVRAFGTGDWSVDVPRHGTQEVRELSKAFAAMREEIQNANRALVESERLATIGRMASSVSHDLRHYLASIYANAEFLSGETLAAHERSEILSDIQSAVHGTTDMIDSLLIFSRAGNHLRTAPELMATSLERAAVLVRAHPDAHGVKIVMNYGDPVDTAVVADAKQIERAIQNLLLNACQSPRESGVAPIVEVTLERTPTHVVMTVIDNGMGIPEAVRANLFEPFVSEGKQKGTGLGLTLAHTIAMEHGGDVSLVCSRPGKTVFQLRVVREHSQQAGAGTGELQRTGRGPR